MRAVVVVFALTLLGCGRDPAPAAGSAAGSAAGTGSAVPRVVSLSPSATEVVAALDATSMLVGV
ncbi:MAG: hypothetical protein AB7L28_28245, partial [Kofleriaceae bacterium]